VSFVTPSADGLELVDASYFAQPVDFVSVASGYTLVALIDWWRNSDPEPGVGLFRFMDEPKQRGPRTWAFTRLGGVMVLQPLSTHATHDTWKAGRQYQDFDRSRYLDRLWWLEGQYPDHTGIPAWREYVHGLPVPDVVQATRNRFTASRSVGVLPLHGPDGAIVDALACDDLGNAATASGHDWLESLASQWVAYEGPRPDLQAFLAWAAGQRPHGSAYPGTPSVSTAEGSTKRIAGKVAAGIL